MRVAFAAFPDTLEVRAFHRGSEFGTAAEQVILRDPDGTLLFAFANTWVDELDPPWFESLDPFEVALGDSDCDSPIAFPCATCQTRSLSTTVNGEQSTLLHGDLRTFGPWTFHVWRLVTCEHECEPGLSPEFSVAIIHESILQ